MSLHRDKLFMTQLMDDADIEHSHSPDAIAHRLDKGPQTNYLRDWVFGGIDGAVTTFAIVAGVAGASLSTTVILILGIANLLADGFSMAAGAYSGIKAEKDDYERLRQMEHRHIKETPEGEREEIRQIFAAKGFEGEDLERAVDIITASHERWVQVMLEEEHGAPKMERSAVKSGLVTFGAFFVCGAVPLLPFIFGGASGALTTATIMTGLTFFGIGSLKSRWSTTKWWKSGFETFSIGMVAAGVAFGVGMALKGLVG